MKIKDIKINDFKRFSNLNIHNIPESTKLVVMLGPNGCGKSSLFDAFRTWHSHNVAPSLYDNDYYPKTAASLPDNFNDAVDISFYKVYETIC